MAGAILTTAITADITDLQTKLAAARSAYNAASADLNKFANEARKAGQDLTASLNPAVAKTAAAVAAGKAEITKLADELKSKLKPAHDDATKSFGVLSDVIGKNRVAFNELTHTTRAVADGLAAGINPMTLFSEEFFRVAQAITEFNTISLTTIARFGAIAGAVGAAALALRGYAAIQGEMRDSRDISAGLNVRGIEMDAQQVQNLRGVIKAASITVKELKDVSDDSIDEMVQKFARVPGASGDMVKALAEIMPGFAAVTHQTAEKATEDLAAAFTHLGSEGGKLAWALDATGTKFKEFAAASNDPLKQRAMLFKDLTQAVIDYTMSGKSAEQNDPKIMAYVKAQMSSLMGDPRALETLQYGDRQEDAIRRATMAQKDFNAALAATPSLLPEMEAVNTQLEKIDQNKDLTPDKKLKAQIDYLETLDGLHAQSADAQEAYARLVEAKKASYSVAVSAQALRDIELQAKEAGAKAVATRKDQQAAMRAVFEADKNDARLDAEDKERLATDVNTLTMRLNRSAATDAKKSAAEQWQDYSANMKNAIDDAKGNFATQTKLAEEWVAHGRELFGQHVHAYENAMEEENRITQEHAAAMKKAIEEQGRMAEAQADITANLEKAGGRGTVGEFKPSMSLVFDPGALKAKVDEQTALIQQELNAKLAGLQEKVNIDLSIGDKNGATEAVDKASADVAASLEKIQALNDKAAQAVQQSWDKITQPIGNAFSQAFDTIARGGQNTGLALEREAFGIVESWAKSGLKVVADWGAAELEKTFLTTAGTTTRAAITNQGDLQLIQQLAKQVGLTVTSQAGQTAAVGAGAATRTAITTTAAATGKAAEAAAGSTTVMAAAAKAAAGAYSSVAQIPYVGWILAPAAAVAAFGAVAAYETVASAEGGQERVPYDGQMTELHKNEMVLPAHVAQSVRDMAASGASLPKAASMVGGSSTTVHNSGDTSHAITVNQTNHVHGEAGAATRSALDRSRNDLHSTVQAWYGKNQVGLAGRKTWR